MKREKSYIARVLLVSFCLGSSLVSASDDTASIDHIKGTLDILNGYIQSDQMQFLQGWKAAELSALADVVPVQYQNRVVTALTGVDMDGVTQNPYHNVNAYLESLLRAFYGTVPNNNYPVSYSLSDYMQETRQYLASMYLFQQTNHNFSSSSQDILAGNPWWATNSEFTAAGSQYTKAFPGDGSNDPSMFSFPQFLSLWSGRLSVQEAAPTLSTLQKNWKGYFGYNDISSNASVAKRNQRSYTVFDWYVDAMRSNWVAQATQQSTLDSILAASLSFGATNTVNVVVTNIVGGITNILNAEDILAGNPWWATNSGFVTDYYRLSRSGAYPPSAYPHDSFPVFASQLSAAIYQPNIPDYPYSSDYMTRWGRGGANWNNGVYTWYDWIADYLRSNLVLTTSVSATNLDQELLAADYDTDTSDTITNTPLPGYEFPVEDVSSLQDEVASGQTSFEHFVDSIAKPGTGGNSEIVVIPEFTIGGIHVREYRADLNTPIVPYCRRVLIFLYYVGVGVFIFQLAKSEYSYYATLGRHWGSH